MTNIYLAGVQGSGKGTQGKRIAKHFGLVHFSTGEMFRDEYARQTQNGMIAHSYWGFGEYVPDQLTITMTFDCLKGTAGSVLDGFPRTLAQSAALGAAGFTIDHVIELWLPDPVAIDRLSYRRVCPCGQEYGLVRMPKVAESCDACGKNLVAREDDKHELIEKRIAEHHAKTKPVIEFYAKRDIVSRVDAAQHPDKVFKDCLDCLEQAPKRRLEQR